MNKASSKHLISDSFSSVRLPAGSFLFFPEWDAKNEAAESEVNSVVIQSAPTRLRRLDGAVVGSALYVVVDKTRFRKFAALLRRRPIAEKPIKFAFELNARRGLEKLLVDGEDFFATASGRSRAAGLKSESNKSCPE